MQGDIVRFANQRNLLAHGDNKAEAIAMALEGPITPNVPASILQLHPDVTVIIDSEASARVSEFRPETR